MQQVHLAFVATDTSSHEHRDRYIAIHIDRERNEATTTAQPNRPADRTGGLVVG